MKASLPPHGYEGRRATPGPISAQQMPTKARGLLDAGECAFTPVTDAPGSPVRLHHRGICAGVFPSRAAANAILGIIAGFQA